MTKKTDAWMPLYVADYLADTSRLTTEQHGAYLLILMDYWRNGPPPDDDAVLCSITRMQLVAWKRARPALVGFFSMIDGFWRQKRADAEKQSAADVSSKRSLSGKQGAGKRWGKTDGIPMANAIANDIANASQNDAPTHSHSHSPSESKPPKPPKGAGRSGTVHEFPPGFDRWWEAYPKKVGKDAAAKAFAKRKVDESLLVAMLQALAQQRQSEQWLRERGRFIPNPATWLNEGRWQDESGCADYDPMAGAL